MGQGSHGSGARAALLTPLTAAAFAAGVVAVQALESLPPSWLDALLGALGLIAVLRHFGDARGGRAIGAVVLLLACVALGFAWSAWRAQRALAAWLPPAWEGQDVLLTGRVVGLPQRGDGSLRFFLDVDDVALPPDARLAGLVRVAWYDTAPDLAPCETWRLRLRLKRPRGLVNPGGFDAERHALEQGLVAHAYVRDDPANGRLAAAPACVDGLRARLSQAIAARLGDATPARLLRALAVGDQGPLDDTEWQVLRATGVGHLIAISGLHVGLVAAFGVLLARGAGKLVPRLGLHLPLPLLEAPAGLVLATGYAALAGFGLPTTRTLLMIGVVALARIVRRTVSAAQSLALAGTAILCADPLAALSAGFWLSFVGVAFLVLCLSGPARAWWRELGRAQGAMSLGLLPLSAWFFGQSAVVGPLANVVAVPFVSLLVVPLALVGTALLLPLPTLGGAVLDLAALALRAQWWLLQQLAAWPGAQWFLPEAAPWAVALALVGALWCLAPRGVPLRWVGLLLFAPLLWPRLDPPGEGEFDVDLLDVGQGLAVLVRTREHALVFDAGARYPSGFDLGEAAVVPAAHALGVRRIDRLIVSHADNDHAGGARAVATALHPSLVQSGDPARVGLGAQACRKGESWTWDGVRLRFLGPQDAAAARDNDRSCVLAVEGQGARLLLTGDIHADVEPAVAAALGPGPPLLLVLAHHGSRSSTSAAFLAATGPVLALVSAGYRSRFGHPHADVVRRVGQAGVPLFNTAEEGCLRLRLARAGPRWLERCRRARAAYWRAR